MGHAQRDMMGIRLNILVFWHATLNPAVTQRPLMDRVTDQWIRMFISRYTISRSNEKFPVLSAHDPCVTCYGGPLTESFVLYIHSYIYQVDSTEPVH